MYYSIHNLYTFLLNVIRMIISYITGVPLILSPSMTALLYIKLTCTFTRIASDSCHAQGHTVLFDGRDNKSMVV
jgi:hypothetical protein